MHDDVKPQNAAHFVPAADDVFGRIADRYDFLCDVFSIGAHRLWKARMAKRIASTPGAVLLDLASGTGDIPQRVLRQRGPEGITTAREAVWITDLSPAMLAKARSKLNVESPVIRYAVADAEQLTGFSDQSIDVVSIAFGMKICDRGRVLSEAFRVLKPGGRFYCLEAARIPLPWLHVAYLRYMDWCLPMIARLCVRGDASAYNYLLRGVHDFPSQTAFCAEIAAAGFAEVDFENMTLGIVALHKAEKPGQI
jgi:ubiquinone/menaquinone biosynthesis methyltransferase